LRKREVKVCRFCGRWLGYFWRCAVCGETYCFIHRDRHVCRVVEVG